MSVERVELADLHAYPGNPRRGNIEAIAESLSVNGQYRPVVVNRRNQQVLAGNHTVMAARRLGWKYVDATYVDADEEQAARIVLADNRANDVAGYDGPTLAELLRDIDDLAGTGYTDQDVEAIEVALSVPGTDEWAGAFGALPDGERTTELQMTFTLHRDQLALVEDAIDAYGPGDETKSHREQEGAALAAAAALYLNATHG